MYRKPEIGDTPLDMVKWEWSDESLAWLYKEVLKSAYLYHVLNKNNISDMLYDARCSVLLLHYDRLVHPFKNLFDRERLETGTCMGLNKEDFPEDVIEWCTRYYSKQSRANEVRVGEGVSWCNSHTNETLSPEPKNIYKKVYKPHLDKRA